MDFTTCAKSDSIEIEKATPNSIHLQQCTAAGFGFNLQYGHSLFGNPLVHERTVGLVCIVVVVFAVGFAGYQLGK